MRVMFDEATVGQHDPLEVPRNDPAKRLRGKAPIAPSDPIFRSGPGVIPHPQNVLEPELQHPRMRGHVSEVLDEIDEHKYAAGSMEHRYFAHDSCSLYQHLFDFTGPRPGRLVAQHSVIPKAAISLLDARTDPGLGSGKRRLRAYDIEVVEVARRDDMGHRTKC